MIKFIKKPLSIIFIIVILNLVLGGYFYFNREKKSEFDIITAKKGNLIQEVSVTGRVKPSKNVELAFEKSGKVLAVYTNINAKVQIGQELVKLDSSEIFAQILQAKAGVEKAKAELNQYQTALEIQKIKLAELKRGTIQEEIQVQETKILNAKISIEDAKQNLINKLNDVYTVSDDTIRNKIDQLFSNPQTQNPQLIFFTNNSQTKIDLEWERLLLEFSLKSWQISLNAFTITNNFNSYLDEAKKNLNQIKSFVDKTALAVNGLTPNNGVSQNTIDTWKSNIGTARTNLNTTINNLTSAEEKLRSAESTLNLEENNLVLKKAGATYEQIATQEAQIKQAEANLMSQEAKIKEADANVSEFQAQISKTILYAPISGTITKQNAKIGEIVSANTPIISLISTSLLEIEANIPEADIAKIKIGNDAKTTLDAYGNDIIFNIKVTAIDPAETIIDGVTTYKVTFQFIEKNEQVKSGMTANIDISTEKLNNVIIIPQRAIITKNGEKFVKIFDGNISKEIKVKTGLRGSDGNIEIINGINANDKIIVSF